MHGQLEDVRDVDRSRHLWRIRREAMEAKLARRSLRRRARVPTSRLTRQAIRLLKPTRLFSRLAARALDLRFTRLNLTFPDLPPVFDGYRILHLTDLHLDHMDGTAEATADLVAGTDIDLCVLTGDIRDNVRSPSAPVIARLGLILSRLHPTDGFLGILGNHDSAAMVAPMEALGVRMLCNEIVHLERGDARIHVTGLDDVHRFHTDAAHVTLDSAPDGFGIALVHSPEIADRAAARHRLYLTGHTHGGQICLPWGRPLVTGLKRNKHLVSGLWQHGGMVGYTSRGVGVSVLPLRLNCPGEVVLVTLKRGDAAANIRSCRAAPVKQAG